MSGQAWAGILVAALALRVSFAISDPVIQRDGVTFLSLAREAREGNPSALLRHDQHPLYPALAAAAHSAIGDWELAGTVIAIAAGVLTVIPVVLLGARVAGAKAGFLGGWVFAAARCPVEYGAQALADSLHGLFFATSAWAGAAALGLGRKESPAARAGFGSARHFLVAGLLSGLAYLTRPEGLVIGFALGAAAAVRLAAMRARREALAAFLKGQALLLLGLLVTAGPYAAFISFDEGTLTLTRKKAVVDTVAGAGAPRAERTERARPRGQPRERPPIAGERAKPMKDAPTGLVRRGEGVLRSLREFAEGLGWAPAALLLAGLVKRRRERGDPIAEAYLFLPLLVFLVLLSGVYATAGYTGRRHLHPLTGIAEGWVGLGLVALGEALARLWPAARWAPRAPAALAAALVLAMAPKSSGLLPDADRDKDLWGREVGLDLRTTIAPADSILAAGETTRAAFYSGGRVLPHRVKEPAADLRRVFALANRTGARWALAEAAPGAATPDPPAGWKSALRVARRGREVAVYRRLGEEP